MADDLNSNKLLDSPQKAKYVPRPICAGTSHSCNKLFLFLFAVIYLVSNLCLLLYTEKLVVFVSILTHGPVVQVHKQSTYMYIYILVLLILLRIHSIIYCYQGQLQINLLIYIVHVFTTRIINISVEYTHE